MFCFICICFDVFCLSSAHVQGQSLRHQSEAGGMRSKPARPPPPQPIIRSYQDAIDFLVEQFKKVIFL